MNTLDDMAAYHDTHSAADEIEAAVTSGTARWENDVDTNPMIGITIRLPKSVLDAVRELAANQRIKPTALIRNWVENAVIDGEVAATPNMTALAHVIRESVHAELVSAKLAA